MSSKLRFAGVTFSVPMSWIGTALQGNAKKQFAALKSKIDVYNAYEISSENILIILDAIERIKKGGYSRSVPVLNEIVHYLRVLLLSSAAEIVYHTLVLLDSIVKNSGFILHIMIGRRKFMKTISWVVRKHTSEPAQANRKVGDVALDCVQAWGEAFYPREEFYPHIYRTYMKLRYKYKMQFPRPDFDPTRVPIFLGEVSHSEKTMANTFNNDLELSYASLEETKEEPQTVTLRAQPRRPPRGYVSPPESPVHSNQAEERVEVPQREEKDLIEFEHADFTSFFSSRQQYSYSDSDFGTLEQNEESHFQLPQPTVTPPWASTTPSSASSGVKPSSVDQVMSLYRPASSFAAPGAPIGPTVSPAVPQFSQSSTAVDTCLGALHLTPWDTARSSSALGTGSNGSNTVRHTSQAIVCSNSLPTAASRSIGNTSWDLDGALDLARLAESLPARRGKAAPSQTVMWLSEPEPPIASVPPTLPPLPPPQSPLRSRNEADLNAESVGLVAEALADFNTKLAELQSQSASAEQPVRPLPPPPPPVPAPSVLPQPSSLQPAAPSSLPEPPRVPPPPPPSLITTADALPKCVFSGLPNWMEVSPERRATPSPVPKTPPPSVAISPDVLNPLEGGARSTSSDDDPILTLIQNMNNPDTIAQHGTAYATYPEVPRLQPPMPGPARLIKPSPRRASEALQEMTFNEKIQQQRAKLAHIDPPPTASADRAAPRQSSNPFEDVVLTRFDPTAGPRPASLPKKPEPRKVSFTAPSSDPNNEIKYYGSQRVVLRKAV